MADVIIIQDEKGKYAENLFYYKSTLNDYLQVTRVHKAV